MAGYARAGKGPDAGAKVEWKQDFASQSPPAKNQLNLGIDKLSAQGMLGGLLAQLMGENEVRSSPGIGSISQSHDLIREGLINDRNTYGQMQDLSLAGKKAEVGAMQHELRQAKGGGEKRSSVLGGQGGRGGVPRQGPAGPSMYDVMHQERLNDVRANAQRRRQADDRRQELSMMDALLRKLGMSGGIGGQQTVNSRSTEQQVFNRAGAPEILTLNNTESRDLMPSEKAELIKLVLGGL